MTLIRILFATACFAATAAAQCTVTFPQIALSALSAGRAGTLTFTVNSPTCYGSPVTSNASWIQFAKEGTGIGTTTTLPASGILKYYVSPNPTGSNRVSTFTTLNQTVTVAQGYGSDADPAVVEVLAPQYAVSGKTIEAIARVTNRGSIPTGTFEARFYWSADANITTADTNTGAFCTTTLSSFSDYRCVKQISPPPTPGSTWYLGAIITATPDANTANNVAAAAPPTTVTSACATVDATPISAGADGSTGILNVNAAPGCTWSVFTSLPAGIEQMISFFPLVGTGNGQVYYTVYPNFRNAARTGILNIGGNPVSINQAADPNPTVSRYIRLLYFSFLGRLPSADEIAAQTPYAQTVAARAGFSNALLTTPEFNGKGRFAAGLYVGILNRDAEFAGWLFQRNAMTSGTSTDQLVSNFLNSAEYQLRFGSPTNPQFVQLLYRYVLLREASQSEIDGQSAVLTSGTLNRVQLAGAFLNSNEFRVGTGARLTSFLLTAGLYGRDPKSDERQRLIDELNSGFTTIDLINAILATPEFAAQVE